MKVYGALCVFVNHFRGDNLFSVFIQQSNLHHSQKCIRSLKKLDDITMDKMKRCNAIILWHDYSNTACCMVTARSTSVPSLGNAPQQQKKNCWKRCFLRSLCKGYIERGNKATWPVADELAGRQQHKHKSRKISVLRNSYLAPPNEDTEAIMFGVLMCGVCRSVKQLYS
jgi:hypothetical protein